MPFAGYEMPVQYPSGIVAEHLHTRAAAGLFDVSHMGQAMLVGRDHGSVAGAIERLVPADIAGLEAGVRHVHRVWAARPGDRRLTRLRALARERGVLIDRVEATVIDELATGRTHGGVVALVGVRRERSVAALIGEVGEGSLLVMLDRIFLLRSLKPRRPFQISLGDKLNPSAAIRP